LKKIERKDVEDYNPLSLQRDTKTCTLDGFYCSNTRYLKEKYIRGIISEDEWNTLIKEKHL